MPAARCFALLAFVAGVPACGPALAPSTLPPENEDGTLSGAILLPLTSRSTDGLLGNVWSAGARRVEASRRVLAGAPSHEETRQHVEVLRSVEVLASLGAASAGVGAEASLRRRTDVAYSVDITGYATLEPGPGGYSAESACCVDGRVAAACEGGYVGRLLRGTGKIRYLRRLEGDASASMGPVLSARGGARYELLDETTFVDAFFAFVPERLEPVCSRLSPEQELAPIQVTATENCRVRVYAAGGASQRAQATYYPNPDACWSAAARLCSDPAASVVACPVTYRQADGAVVVRDLAPQALSAGAPTMIARDEAAAAPVAAATAASPSLAATGAGQGAGRVAAPDAPAAARAAPAAPGASAAPGP